MRHIEMIIDYLDDDGDYKYNDNHGILVRCCDCESYFKGMCLLHGRTGMNPDDYCSRGEKKSDE